MKKIMALSAKVPGGKTIYVRATQRRESDNLLQVTTTFNPNDAKDYETKSKAYEAGARLFNPFDRDWTPTALNVEIRSESPETIEDIR